MPETPVPLITEIDDTINRLQALRNELMARDKEGVTDILGRFHDGWKRSYIFLPPVSIDKCPHCGKDL